MTGDIPPFKEAKKQGKMPYPVSVHPIKKCRI